MSGCVGSLGLWCAAAVGAMVITSAAAADPRFARKPDYLDQWIALIEESQKDIADKPNGWVALREAIRRIEANRERWDDEALERWPDGAVDFIMLTADDVEPKYAQTMEATRWALSEAERGGVFAPLEELAKTPRAVFERDDDLDSSFIEQSNAGLGTRRVLVCAVLGKASIAADNGDWQGAIEGVDQALSIARAIDRQPLLLNALFATALHQLALRRACSMSRRPGFDEAAAAELASVIERKSRFTPWELVMRGEAICAASLLESAHYWRGAAPGAKLHVMSAVELAIILQPVEEMELWLGRPRWTWWRRAGRPAANWVLRQAASTSGAQVLPYLLPRQEQAEMLLAEVSRLRGAAMDEPFWRRPSQSQIRTDIARRLPSYAYFVNTLAGIMTGDLKPLMKAAKMRDTVTMLRDATLLMLSIERHKMRHGGVLPATIEALDADLRPPSMIDQATGDALKYRLATADEAAASDWGYAIYSVGADKKDDGGTFERGEDAPYGFYETKPGFDFPLVGVGARR